MKKQNILKRLEVVLGIALALLLVYSIFLPKHIWAQVAEVILIFVETGIIMFSADSKYNAFKVILIAILGLLLLSWVLPAAYYSGQYMDQGRVQMGLYSLFNYPLTSLSYFGFIATYVIFVGGFYGVLYKIPAYRTFLDKIVSAFKGKESVVLSIMIILIAAAVSVCGVQIAMIFFIPLFVSIILLMGYDKITAALVIVGSTVAGLVGSTYAYGNIGMLLSSLSLDINYQIFVRVIILVVAIILVIINTLSYIKSNFSKKSVAEVVKKEVKTVTENVEKKVSKVASTSKKTTQNKKNSSKSKSSAKGSSKTTKNTTAKGSKTRKNNNKAALKDNNVIVVKDAADVKSGYLVPEKENGKHTIWPFICGFILMFILVVMAFMPWGEGGFNLTIFKNATKAVLEFKVLKFPIFAKLYGTVNEFGAWTVTDLVLPMIILLLIIVLIYKVKFKDVLDGFVEGAKKSLAPALVSILIYTILVLVTYHPFQLVIYKYILGMSKGFNIATTIIVALLSSIFNGDVSYVFQSTLPYYASVVTNVDNYPVVGIIFQSMYGVAMLFAPTSLILMGVLSYLKVSYKDWLKNIWKLLLELFIILLIVFIIIALV